jgi:tRNA-dihydrouridine synthase
MRIVARRHGCPFCVTEALLDRTILAGGRGFAKADLGELEDNVPGGAEDQPLAGQIMGSDPREMAAAALKMAEQGMRHDREYRRLAYGGALAPPERMHLRLPGGEQIGGWPSRGAVNPPAVSSPSARETPEARVAMEAVGTAPPLAARTLPPPPLGEDRPRFAAIDVNLACPVKKVDRRARGGHWLAEPEGAIAILEAVREAVPAEISCTVKLRRAYDDTPEMAANLDRILDAAFRIGYAWATVHARTVEQKYIGPSRWDLLRAIVARHPGRLIFGSGDVWEVGEIFRMLAYTGVAAVAVARGCIGNPWIFRQARALLAGAAEGRPSLAEQRGVLEEHFRLALAVNAAGTTSVSQRRRAEVYTGKAMRKFGIRFAAHHSDSEALRRRFIAVTSLDEWRGVLDEFYPAAAEPVECH